MKLLNPKENMRVVKDNYTGEFIIERRVKKFLSCKYKWIPLQFDKDFDPVSFSTLKCAQKYVENEYNYWQYETGLKNRYSIIL